MSEKTRKLLMTVRQTLIMLLNALDEYLGREQTIPTKDDRELLRRLKNQ